MKGNSRRAGFIVLVSICAAGVWAASLALGGSGPRLAAADDTLTAATADTAYLPYYDVALNGFLEDPRAFLEQLEESFERADRSFHRNLTAEAMCLSPDGHLETTTIADCNRRPGQVVQEPAEGCGVGVDATFPEARNAQREIPDGRLAPRERALERQFTMSGIAAKVYVKDTHDCDDFAFRAFNWLRRFFGDTVSVKWYAYTNAAGRRVGHALNDIHWEDGATTYFEPQTGQVVELPEPRTQTFQSTNVDEVNRRQAAETERERRQR